VNLSCAEPCVWLLLNVLVLALILAFTYYYAKKTLLEDAEGRRPIHPIPVFRSLGRAGVLEEVERLSAGGELDDELLCGMLAEDRVLFEVTLIDALSRWPRPRKQRLRRVLMKCGYDDQCARRLMKGSMSSQVRASTLLGLLRPIRQAAGCKTRSMKAGRG
jgi:hypothetical protein